MQHSQKITIAITIHYLIAIRKLKGAGGKFKEFKAFNAKIFGDLPSNQHLWIDFGGESSNLNSNSPINYVRSSSKEHFVSLKVLSCVVDCL